MPAREPHAPRRRDPAPGHAVIAHCAVDRLAERDSELQGRVKDGAERRRSRSPKAILDPVLSSEKTCFQAFDGEM